MFDRLCMEGIGWNTTMYKREAYIVLKSSCAVILRLQRMIDRTKRQGTGKDVSVEQNIRTNNANFPGDAGRVERDWGWTHQ